MDLLENIRGLIKFTAKRTTELEVDLQHIIENDDLIDFEITNKFVLLETEFVAAKIDSLCDNITEIYPLCTISERIQHLSTVYLLNTARRGNRILKKLVESNLDKLAHKLMVPFEAYSSDEDIEMWDATW